MQTDVAIVGAGPAGAAAACHFARAGFRVALLDQRRFPRDKVCGDFVGPVALAELDALGVSVQTSVRDANQIRRGALHLHGVQVVAGSLPRVEGLRDHGVCIPRVVLDDVLVRAAVASGVCLIEEARVTGYETDATGVTLSHQGRGSPSHLRARLLLGADGSASLIARLLRGAPPPRRDRMVAVRGYFEGVSGPADQADLYVNASSLPGYYWLFPTGAGSANVGVVMLVEMWPPTTQPLGRLLAQVIASDPAIRRRLVDAKMCGKIAGWPLATFDPRLPSIGDRVALIGDAAGMINPISGEGIQYALRSARWCLDALRESLANDCVSMAGLRPYAARVRAELRLDMAFSRFLIDLIRNRALNPLWLSALSAAAKRAVVDGRFADGAAGIFMGVAPVREILTPSSVWRTVKPAARSEAGSSSDPSRGSRRGLGSGTTLTDAVGLMIEHAVRHPVATLEWGVHCALSALELATQMAVARRRGRFSIGS